MAEATIGGFAKFVFLDSPLEAIGVKGAVEGINRSQDRSETAHIGPIESFGLALARGGFEGAAHILVPASAKNIAENRGVRRVLFTVPAALMDGVNLLASGAATALSAVPTGGLGGLVTAAPAKGLANWIETGAIGFLGLVEERTVGDRFGRPRRTLPRN